MNGPGHGARRCPACCRKKRGHYNVRTSDQLRIFGYYIKHLHISYLGRLEHFSGSRTAGRAAWASARTTTKRRPCYSWLNVGQKWRCRNPCVDHQLCICRRRLTGCIGLHYGGLLLMRAFLSISYGSCNAYISDNVVKLWVTWGKAENRGRAARVCAKSTFVLCGVTMGDENGGPR